MSVKIWDSESQAFKETQNVPQRYDAVSGAYVDTTGHAYSQEDAAWTERWSANKELVVGIDIPLSQGDFKNVSPSYFDGDDGSSGFTITGTPNTMGNMSAYLRWDIQYDLTSLKYINFTAKKNANHGVVHLYVTDGLYYVEGYGTPCTKTYASIIQNYDIDTNWHDYSLDVSEITGTHLISFVGGYVDITGSTYSSTSYKNIKFVK